MKTEEKKNQLLVFFFKYLSVSLSLMDKIIEKGGSYMPRVRVEWLQGRSKEQRDALSKRITDAFVDIVKVRPDQLTIVFEEISPDFQYKGGITWTQIKAEKK